MREIDPRLVVRCRRCGRPFQFRSRSVKALMNPMCPDCRREFFRGLKHGV